MFTLTECIGLCLIALFIGLCLRKPSWFGDHRSAKQLPCGDTKSVRVTCTPATKDAPTGMIARRRGMIRTRREQYLQLAQALTCYVGVPPEAGSPSLSSLARAKEYRVAKLLARHADVQQLARITGRTTVQPHVMKAPGAFDWSPAAGACPTCVKRITTHITETFGGQHDNAPKPRTS